MLSKTEYFAIAKEILRQGDTASALNHIRENHLGAEVTKSYFYSSAEIEQLIRSAIDSPDDCSISKATRNLIILKSFTSFVGIHRNSALIEKQTSKIEVIIEIHRVVSRGKPWQGQFGKIITAYPTDPNKILPPLSSSFTTIMPVQQSQTAYLTYPNKILPTLSSSLAVQHTSTLDAPQFSKDPFGSSQVVQPSFSSYSYQIPIDSIKDQGSNFSAQNQPINEKEEFI